MEVVKGKLSWEKYMILPLFCVDRTRQVTNCAHDDGHKVRYSLCLPIARALVGKNGHGKHQSLEMLTTAIHKNAQRALGVELEVNKVLCRGERGAAVEENEVWVENRKELEDVRI